MNETFRHSIINWERFEYTISNNVALDENWIAFRSDNLEVIEMNDKWHQAFARLRPGMLMKKPLYNVQTQRFHKATH